MSAAVWKKITRKVKGEEVLLAEPFLEIREGRYKTSFRVRYRQGQVRLEQLLDRARFKAWDDWKEAEKEAKRLIYDAEYGPTSQRPKEAIKSELLCDEIVQLKKAIDPSTYEQAEIMFRVHIKPFLNGLCAYDEQGTEPCPHMDYVLKGASPYAQDLNSTVWLNYKTHFRLHRPEGRLFNHWKYFLQLCKQAHERGIVPKKIRLEFNERKEDARQRGQVIPDEDFRKMLEASVRKARKWYARMLLQKLTIQRPGVIRALRKDQVELGAGIFHVKRLDSKNRTIDYGFMLPRQAVDVLRGFASGPGPYFFPSERDPDRPMDKHLGGWKAVLKRAGVNLTYTPHDIRHTELTRRFKQKGANLALICFQADLSLEEAMETYIHFNIQDTAPIAQESEAMAETLLAGLEASP